MTKYLLIKYLLSLLVVFSLTFPSIAGCPTKVSEEQFDEISKSVTKEHLSEVMQKCKGPCTYHSEASVYIMKHGTAPVEGFEFFPKQIAEVGGGRSDIETAISYLSTSDEQAIKINGVRISRADLLAEKNEGINFLDTEQKNGYMILTNMKLKTPITLDIGIETPALDFRSAKKVIDVLNEIEDNEPFFLGVIWETPSGDMLGHTMPAMRYIEPGTGIKKIRLGMQIGDSQEIVYKDLKSFKSDLVVVLDFISSREVKSIQEISIIEPF